MIFGLCLTFCKLCLIFSALIFLMEVALQILVSHSQCVWSIDKVPNIANKCLEVLMFCFIPHTPLVHKGSISKCKKNVTNN